MERIVQLSQKDYDELYEKAKLNEKEIEDKALSHWKEKGAAKLSIDMRFYNETKETYEIDCDSYLFESTKDYNMKIDNQKFKDDFQKKVDKEILKVMRKEYGKGIDLMNRAKKKEDFLKNITRSMWFFTLSGWGSFIGCLMYLIFGK